MAIIIRESYNKFIDNVKQDNLDIKYDTLDTIEYIDSIITHSYNKKMCLYVDRFIRDNIQDYCKDTNYQVTDINDIIFKGPGIYYYNDTNSIQVFQITKENGYVWNSYKIKYLFKIYYKKSPRVVPCLIKTKKTKFESFHDELKAVIKNNISKQY